MPQNMKVPYYFLLETTQAFEMSKNPQKSRQSKVNLFNLVKPRLIESYFW